MSTTAPGVLIEAGMDMGLSPDIRESFRLFQGLVRDQYESMSDEFDFVDVDATENVHAQQRIVRSIVSEHVDLARYRSRVLRTA